MAKVLEHKFFATIIIIIFVWFIPQTSTSSHRQHCSTKPPRPPPAALFIFGDSLFDAGNNNYINTTTLDQANFWPYGETHFNRPTGRFSDGRLISDFIAEHARLPLITPYLQPSRHEQQYQIKNSSTNYHGVNFASAGAGVLSQTFQGSVIDLETQLKYYKWEMAQLRNKTGDASSILSSAVHLFSIGTNDYTSPFILNSSLLPSYTHSQYVEMVIGNLTLVVKEIYQSGGRKFAFLNLGELGCLPGLRILKPETEGGCLQEASALARLHNKELHKLLSQMEQQYHGFKYFLYDFNTSLSQRIAHPFKYGFKEVEKACWGSGRFNGIFSCGGKRLMIEDFELCRNPSGFIFWDSYHLTERVHQQMADQMWGKTGGTNSLRKLSRCF